MFSKQRRVVSWRLDVTTDELSVNNYQLLSLNVIRCFFLQLCKIVKQDKNTASNYLNICVANCNMTLRLI